MSAAAHNRGSRVVARAADDLMPSAQSRADRAAQKDETERLRERVAQLEKTLSRARRCLAAERHAREARTAELKAELRASKYAVTLLCKLAFPDEKTHE